MKELTIIFATQGGTAEVYARRVAREARKRCIEYDFINVANLDVESLSKRKLVVFIISTTGEGEMPTSMVNFWTSLLDRNLLDTLFSNTSFAIFGLGDSSYEKFNYAGKKLYRRLEQLGATKLLTKPTYGDEQHPLGHDETFIPWLNTLWATIGAGGRDYEQLLEIGPSVRLTATTDSSTNHQALLLDSSPLTIDLPKYKVTIGENKRITLLDHFQDVRHITFNRVETDEEFPIYKPGDVAILSPLNDENEVDELLRLLNWSGDELYQIESLVTEMILSRELSNPITIKELLVRFLDITMPAGKYFCELASRFILPNHPDAIVHKEKLLELASAEGLDLYLDYVWRARRKPVEVLLDFSSIGPIPVDYIFDLFPPLRAREYSISSAWSTTPNEIHITAALVKYQTKLSSPVRWGVCSRWLASLQVEQSTVLSFRAGSWNIPETGPLVMFATGTGVAPMRALIHHTRSLNPNQELYLFFGCRNLQKDFHYHDEWNGYEQQTEKLKVFALGSRDVSGPRRYLSELLIEQKELIRKLLFNPLATFYLAGNSKLPKLIKSTLGDISGDSMLPEQLVRSGRFYIESWS